jgi:hypothetical protein
MFGIASCAASQIAVKWNRSSEDVLFHVVLRTLIKVTEEYQLSVYCFKGNHFWATQFLHLPLFSLLVNILMC